MLLLLSFNVFILKIIHEAQFTEVIFRVCFW